MTGWRGLPSTRVSSAMSILMSTVLFLIVRPHLRVQISHVLNFIIEIVLSPIAKATFHARIRKHIG